MTAPVGPPESSNGRLGPIFQRLAQKCERFLFIFRVGSEHCSEFGKLCSEFACSEFEFGSEHCLNTPSEHFFISQKGGGAEGAAPFFDL